MKKTLLTILCLCFLILLSGCGGIKSKTYTDAKMTEIAMEIKNSNLSQEEKELFLKGIMKSKFFGDSVEGKTIGEIIEGQRKFITEENKKAEEEKAKK